MKNNVEAHITTRYSAVPPLLSALRSYFVCFAFVFAFFFSSIGTLRKQLKMHEVKRGDVNKQYR